MHHGHAPTRIGYASSMGEYKGILGERQSASARELKRGAKLLDPALIKDDSRDPSSGWNQHAKPIDLRGRGYPWQLLQAHAPAEALQWSLRLQESAVCVRRRLYRSRPAQPGGC